MVEVIRTLKGRDLGILVGGNGEVIVNGILLYLPKNALVPALPMTPEQLERCLPRMRQPNERIKLDSGAINQVLVNESPVWRNRDYHDLTKLGVNPHDQSYWGRGNVELEIIDPATVEKLAEGIDSIKYGIFPRLTLV